MYLPAPLIGTWFDGPVTFGFHQPMDVPMRCVSAGVTQLDSRFVIMSEYAPPTGGNFWQRPRCRSSS